MMSIVIDDNKVQCEVCGAVGSRRFRGHDLATDPHPWIIGPDEPGSRASRSCVLCGIESSPLHLEHEVRAAFLEQSSP